MSDSHHNGNGNGNGNGWRMKSSVKGLQMFAADVVGNAAEVVFLKYQDNFDRAFPFLKQGFKKVMYYPMKLLQKPIEWGLDHLGSIEGEKGREERHSRSNEQRLEDLLETGYHYASAVGVGWGSLVMTEKGLSRMMHTKELPSRMWWRVDFPVHLGTAAFLGSKTMQPVTGKIKDFTKNLMLASGWSEDKAEQDSRFAVAYILPNYLTLIPTTAMMTGFYHAETKGVVKDLAVKKGAMFGDSHEHHFQLTGKPPNGDVSTPTKAMLNIAEFLGVIGHGPAKGLAHA